jgi:murein DD-endopeptidase MepM/ murein hydrolase activator NlpD
MAFEKKFLDGKFSGYGEILAAEFICQGKTFQAFRFVYPDTKKSDYFDAGGKSLRKQFMKSPLPYARITSRFSYSRLHPIHKVYRAHYGVDYGAPVGYPVRATADGTVTFAGWNGASGRMVRIRHKNSYETMYLHLQQILVKLGDRVSGGQDIGTVGSSGESTGPHLDYRIKQGGSYINPLSQRFSPVEPLRAEFKDAFGQEVKSYLVLLDAPLYFYSILCRR